MATPNSSFFIVVVPWTWARAHRVDFGMQGHLCASLRRRLIFSANLLLVFAKRLVVDAARTAMS
jgi:hypothetical protein